ncbi:MAG: hypothetical protein LC742_00825 [Acidobacteria bacterium]|nr:hypothetical protein [Acidobacteriota bacterium]
MSGVKRIGDVEINQDLDFQRLVWTVQRVGWVVTALLIVAALLGLFGPGPLSWATAGEGGAPLRLEYNRFERYLAPTTLRVHTGAGAGREGQLRIWLDRTYLEGVQVESVTPQPDSVEAGTDRMTYVFQMPDPNGPTAITFNLLTQQIGTLRGRVGLAEGQTVTFTQFVYP